MHKISIGSHLMKKRRKDIGKKQMMTMIAEEEKGNNKIGLVSDSHTA
jgi:hypothetical protein